MSSTERRLAATLSQVVRTQGANTQLFCLYLVDGSGSIDKKNFNGPLKEGIQALANNFSRATQAVAQFSTDYRVEVIPTSNVDTVITGIKAMVQYGAGTFTASAIQKATEMIRGFHARNFSCHLFLFTDGLPSNPSEYPDANIRILKSLGTTVYVLGIGDPTKLPFEDLSSWSSEGGAFNIDDYPTFLRALSSVKDQNAAEAEQLLATDITPTSTNLRSGQSLPLKLTIRALTHGTPIPANTIVTFKQNKYFEQCQVNIREAVTIDKPWSTNLELRVRSDTTEEDFPGLVEFSFTIRKGAVSFEQTGQVLLATGVYRGDFETATPVNVLLFGFPGSGKSALGNTIITCLATHPVPSEFLTVARRDTHVTTNYQKVYIGKHVEDTGSRSGESDAEKIKLQIYDPWGASESDYRVVKMKDFLNGHVIPGAEMKIVEDCTIPYSDKANKIHVVIFLFPLTMIRAPEPTKILCNRINEVISMGITPLLVVTRIDDMEDVETRENLQKQIVAAVQINANNIYFHQNYSTQITRQIDIDISTRKILGGILRRYKHRKDACPEDFEDVDWKLETVLKPKSAFTGSGGSTPKRQHSVTSSPKVKILNEKQNTPSNHKFSVTNSTKLEEEATKDYTEERWEDLLRQKNIPEPTIDALRSYGVCHYEDLQSFEDSDFQQLNLPPFQLKRLRSALTAPDEVKELSVSDVLANCSLTEFTNSIETFGVSTVEDLRNFDIEDAKTVGMKNFQFTRLQRALEAIEQRIK